MQTIFRQQILASLESCNKS